jgi:hypothetical protein
VTLRDYSRKVPPLKCEDPEGRCHICAELKAIRYCGLCKHWFCPDCRKAYFWRGLAAINVLLEGAQEGCCGPRESA